MYYWALNNLLPWVTEVHSKANKYLTLVPLSKINDMYAKLASSSICCTSDLRSGYYHIALPVDSQRKSTFVTPMGKFEFQKVPFGLAKAPSYFQQLVNEV